jgi:hypothetical protein
MAQTPLPLAYSSIAFANSLAVSVAVGQRMTPACTPWNVRDGESNVMTAFPIDDHSALAISIPRTFNNNAPLLGDRQGYQSVGIVRLSSLRNSGGRDSGDLPERIDRAHRCGGVVPTRDNALTNFF